MPSPSHTDTAWSPLVRDAILAFTIKAPDVRSLAAAICPVPTLIVALGRYRLAGAEATGTGIGRPIMAFRAGQSGVARALSQADAG